MKVCPTEAAEGKLLVAYLRVKGLKFTHIPNETGSSMEARQRAIRMKQQGTSRGFPDYLVIVPRGLLVIELKRQFGSATSPEQKEWIAAFNNINGVEATIARGADAAIKFIESFL